jgi:hypothetical protein
VFPWSPTDLSTLIDQHEELVSQAGIAKMQSVLAIASEPGAAASDDRVADR